MATTSPAPSADNNLPDPAQLGADQSPITSREDDSHDMSPVLAETDKDQYPSTAGAAPSTKLGSDFDHQRQQGATGTGNPDGEVGQGMGRAGYNGDEDRGYDQSSYRGGLGSSGGRDERPSSEAPADPNPFTGGNDQPSADQTSQLGLHTPNPAQ